MPRGRRWPVNIACPTCEVEADLKECFYTAKGEICFIACCRCCNKKCSWTVAVDNLKAMARKNDLRAKKNEIIQSPLPAKYGEEDAKFLQSFKIKP